MAREAGLSRTTARRIRKAFGLQPHRSEAFKLYFLEEIDARVPEDPDVRIVMDKDTTP